MTIETWMIPVGAAAFIGLIVGAILLFARLYPPTPPVIGDLRVIGKYGGDVEIYDGAKWCKARVPAEHIAALIVKDEKK